MGIAYIGVSAFTLQKIEFRGSANDVGSSVETWRGKKDLTDAFINSKPRGAAYAGGYIIDVNTREGRGYTEVDVIVARAPDFNKSLINNSVSIKTATKSGSVGASNFDGYFTVQNADGTTIEPEEVSLSKTVSYYSPESRYTYFSSTKPNGARFNTMAIATGITRIRSSTKASANGKELDYGNSLVPAAVSSALSMPVEVRVVSHEAEQIPGTPWFRCVDVVARELKGDS